MSVETRNIPPESIDWELRDDQTDDIIAKVTGGGSMPPTVGSILAGVPDCGNWQVTQFGGINTNFSQDQIEIFYVIYGRCIQIS